MRLPPADEIEFKVTRHRDRQAHYTCDVRGNDHEILISEFTCGHFATLVTLIGHEMVHLDQSIRKTAGKTQHNVEFRRVFRAACERFRWDYAQFITT